MTIQIVYGCHRKIKILDVDSKFKTILVTENYMSIWQELVNELHQIVRSEVECDRYAVYEMGNKKLMYTW